MKQYHDLKARYAEEILLFRLGDFYEMFEDDARKAAPILEVALTHRQHIPMCGVPAHAADSYIAKLLKAGLRVAVADQLEDPALAKGLVKRDVVRVITAGTLQEEALLSARQCNFLVALAPAPGGVGLAAIECSTGEFMAAEIAGENAAARAWDEVARLGPSEVVLPASPEHDALRARLKAQGIAVAELPPADFSAPLAQERLKALFRAASLRGFGLENKDRALAAAGAAVRYLETTQCGRPVMPAALRTYDLDDSLQMDANTLDHLDLFPESGPSRRVKTLLDTVDQTLTPPGGRMMRRWLAAPLRNVAAIRARQEKVALFLEGKEGRRQLRAALQGWPDVERILTRLSAGSANPRDLAALGQGLRRLPKIKTHLAQLAEPLTRLGPALPPDLAQWLSDFPEEPALADLLERALVDGPPASLKDGGVIRAGYDAGLDEVRGWIHDGKSRLLELEKREREQTGISTLKIGFNAIFGYYLEITKSHVAKAPLHYVRKQTMANGERYITPELKEFETRILGAEERALRLEGTLLQELRRSVLERADTLRRIAQQVGEADVFAALAEVADRRRYVKPFVDDSCRLLIREGRHPVLEEVLPSGTLVANDLDLDGTENTTLILTGPNMSGKSTYLRQTALIAILAQMGSYVPAAEAHIGVLDHLFTRIGASDRLTEGESTFMVEMVETARILNHATPRSLVILDEVGRGTSTYDGISIAWACLEYLNGAPGSRLQALGNDKQPFPGASSPEPGVRLSPKVLFATHYFELTKLAETLAGVRNAHVTAREWGDHVVFLHKVEPGPADRAYGIHVARLAGVPPSVLRRAAALLGEFEQARMRGPEKPQQPSLFPEATGAGNAATENDTLSHAWVDALRSLDIHAMTPIQALLTLQDLKDRFGRD